ncbi:hypothetical protein Ae168Ps1_1793c [Pseudonocardia sp. Ae168_Ps1]|nr:hypothetical protein Ae150APs1_1789c [Pseudonocardia sp. Ae150A_Ps1]OLL79387.1 hypothetical protein Ae168Ps1_1793c [Pseudonocardia sp. Ae168_Ps1]OLL86478.1 hypothetical protein Ae263Ps1_3533 [Pseudonocardia sp. Ae263_Ps1]OLL93473.1 hypothetical protein Ae356Ps1_3370c [Pseudonocardia sp. Ae356_Ps1]
MIIEGSSPASSGTGGGARSILVTSVARVATGERARGWS